MGLEKKELAAMIWLNKKMITGILRKAVFFLMVVLGLASIVATGDEDDDTNNAPVARIDTPVDNTVFELDNQVTFTGTATDTEDNVLSGAALAWESSVDGRIGSGSSVTTDNLSHGTHLITLTATDSQGNSDSVSITITMNPTANTLPTATITNPATGLTFDYGNYINFTGTGYDAEDGVLSGTALVWSSNQDGPIGTGSSISTNNLTGGIHIISLKATDSDNTSHTATITVTVRNTNPVATITWPADGDTFGSGDSIVFNGTGFDTEDGDLTSNALVWSANNGDIGYGPSISISSLPVGTIKIYLTVMDRGGLVDTDSITITIE